MRLLVHDMHGYAFVRDLAANLALRGHEVIFVTCSSVGSPNRASHKRVPDLKTEIIALKSEFPKYDVGRRLVAEMDYGRRVARVVFDWKPDVVLSSNCPLLSQRIISKASHRRGAAFIFWVQDLYGPAAQHALSERLPIFLAKIGAFPFIALERQLLRRSDHVISIGQALSKVVASAGVPASHRDLIPNWTDPSKVGPTSDESVWRSKNHKDVRFLLVYSGTLGKKHPYRAFAGLAKHLPEGTHLSVISQGIGASWLRGMSTGLPLSVVDFVPESELPDVLSSADVLVLTLGEEASRYSVPSKLYTYLCAGRPILGFVPRDSEVGRLIETLGVGVVTDIANPSQAAVAIRDLTENDGLRDEMGRRGRDWAERNMNTDRVTERFDSVLTVVSTRHDLAAELK